MENRRFGKLIGWGSYVPEKVVTNHDLAQQLDTSHEWILQRTGIVERRIAGPDETTSTLATNAARRALQKADLSPTDIDLIVVGNTAPDYLTPPVSSQVQHALGATNAPAFVVETGCTGFVYALAAGYQFIETGAYRRVLIIGVEMLSRHIDWEDRSTAVLFGDGAGAVILEGTDEPCGLLGFDLGSDGGQGEHIIVPAGGTVEPLSQEALDDRRQFVQMNGRAVFKFATRIFGQSCRASLDRAGLGIDEIDWIIPHQANLRIIQAAARSMDLPLEKFYVNIDRYANTSAASIPIALVEGLENGQIRPDDRLMIVAFGAGLTWASAVWQLAPQPLAEERPVALETATAD